MEIQTMMSYCSLRFLGAGKLDRESYQDEDVHQIHSVTKRCRSVSPSVLIAFSRPC